MTPSTLRRRDISVATCAWPALQPLSSLGRSAAIALWRPLPPASLEIVPLSSRSVTSAGTAREMSRSACSQSKREAARSLTVWMRVSAIAWKSAYGLSWLTARLVASACGGDRLQLRLTVLDRVGREHVRGERDNASGERAERHESADAARLRRGDGGAPASGLGRAAKVGGEQVDGLHLAGLIGTPLARLEASRWESAP